MIISNIPRDERPRERCLKGGARYLSIRECMALLLGSGLKKEGSLGLAERVLQRCGPGLDDAERFKTFVQLIMREDLGFLSDVKGVGKARSAKLLAFAELARRIALEFTQTSQATAPAYVYREDLEKRALKIIPFSMRAANYEWVAFVPIDKQGKVGSFNLLQRGDLGAVHLDVPSFFRKLLLLDVHFFFLFHNHPSGSLKPSNADKAMTQEIASISASLGLTFLGHWIVTRDDASCVS